MKNDLFHRLLGVSLLAVVFAGAGCTPAVENQQPQEQNQDQQAPLSENQQKMMTDLLTTGGDQDCPETTTESTQRYDIIGQCLYRDGQRMFQKSLPYLMVTGAFGQAGVDAIYFPMYTDHSLGSTQEWFWFTKDKQSYVYFRAGGRSCQGCEMGGGPRVVVDETTGAVLESSVVPSFPPPSTLILSPDYTEAALVQWDDNQESVSLYSLVDNAIGPVLFTAPEDQTLKVGCYENVAPCNYEISWTDQNHIEIHTILLDEDGNRIQDHVTDDGEIVYKFADPVTLEIE